MSNGKIFYNNLIANAAVSASSEAAGFEKEYLYNNNQGVVWRSTGITGTTITMAFTDDLGSPAATPVKGIEVMNHNLESGDTFVFEYSANGTDFTPHAASVDWQTGLLELDTDSENPDNWSYPYYRLRMSKSSGDYIQVGEIFLIGSRYDFERNFQWNYTYTREINRNSRQTTSGQIYRKTRFIRKSYNLSFDGIDDAQKEIFETIAEDDYVCFMPTGSGGDLHYGIIDFSAFNHIYTNYWSASFTFTENPK